MASYLTSNMKFAAKNVGFTSSKDALVESSDEELGGNIPAIALECNKTVSYTPFLNERKIRIILLISMIRYFSMFLYAAVIFPPFQPQAFMVPCNVENLMSINEMNILQHNISDIHEEIKSITIVNGYRLTKNVTAFLNEKHRNYTASLINYEAELEYQRENHFNCYKENISNYMEKQQLPVIGFVFLMGVSYIIIIFTFIKAKMSKLNERQLQNLKGYMVATLFFLIVDGVAVCSLLDEFRLDNKFAKFPL